MNVAGSNKLSRGVLAGLVVSVVTLYSLTLMTDVTNCVSPYCDDAGEFQLALAQGGTVHPTGYPLYMLLGTPFVSFARALGASAAAAGSLYSLVWQVLAIAGVFAVVQQETRSPWLGGAAALCLAVTRSWWVHGVIAEVYSLSMALSVWILWLALKLHARWSDSLGWLLALAGGLGVAHHRLIAVMLPVIGLWLLPQAWRSGRFWRWLGVAVLCFLAGFLPYLDIPFRAWEGAPWLYNQADRAQDFWRIFWAGDYLRQPNHSLATVLASARQMWSALRDELGLAGIGACLAGALLALVKAPRRAWLWWGVGLSYVAFALFVSNVMIEAKLMPLVLCLVVAGAIGAAQLPKRWQLGAGSLLLAGGIWLGAVQYPVVVGLTHNHRAEAYIALVEKLEAPPGSVVMGLWGQQFFDLYYAQHFEGGLSEWQLVDHRADFKTLVANTDGRVYMSADALNVFKVDEWRQRLGQPLRLTSAGPGLLAVTARPLPAPAAQVCAIGDGLALAGWEIRVGEDHTWDVVTDWVATRTVTADYSTFVYVTDKDKIVDPDDILGQSDFSAPVYGWYPTSQWQPNEVVREDHVIALPATAAPRTVIAGMYREAPDDEDVPLGQVVLGPAAGNSSACPGSHGFVTGAH